MQPAPENPLNQTPFEALGGEDRVRALTDAFYDRMDQDPSAAPIRKMHPEDLTESRQKLFEFLCGWLGGHASLAIETICLGFLCGAGI